MANGKEKLEKKSEGVSAGTIDRVIDYAFNPSREKIREMTIVDRLQARYFPMLDTINLGRQYCMEVAIYRQDKKVYKVKFNKEKPIMPNLLEEFVYRTAQWQKSIAGKNLEKATDIALAEIETKFGGEEDMFKGEDVWKE